MTSLGSSFLFLTTSTPSSVFSSSRAWRMPRVVVRPHGEDAVRVLHGSQNLRADSLEGFRLVDDPSRLHVLDEPVLFRDLQVSVELGPDTTRPEGLLVDVHDLGGAHSQKVALQPEGHPARRRSAELPS